MSRVLLLGAVLLVGHDLFLRRQATQLAASIEANDWKKLRAKLHDGVQFLNETDKVHAFRMAATEEDQEALDILTSDSCKPTFSATSRTGALFEAIDLGERAAVLSLLKHGGDPNVIAPFGSTLERAVRSGRNDIAAILRERGARYTAGEAAIHGEARDLQYWLDRGADPGGTFDNSGNRESFLHAAAASGSVEAVKLLLSRGAPVDQLSVTGGALGPAWESALFSAARSGKVDCLRLLVNAGASVNMRSLSFHAGDATPTRRPDSSELSTPLLEAAMAGHPEAVKFLLQHKADINARTKSGNSALTQCLLYSSNATSVGTGFLKTPETGLTAPKESGNLTENEKTTLTDIFNREQTAKLLLEAKPDLFNDTSYPLILACKNGFLDLAPYFLARGANVNAVDAEGRSALMYTIAARERLGAPPGKSKSLCSETALFLLNHGANPEFRTREGQTPLLLAALYNEPIVVRALLRKSGVHTDTRDSQGKGLRDYALVGADRIGVPSEDRVELIEILHGLGIRLCLNEAAYFGILDDVKRQLAAGANVNATVTATGSLVQGYESQSMYLGSNGQGQTGLKLAAALTTLQRVSPLAIAAGCGHPEVVRILLDHGARIDAADSRGWTPLMCAAANNRADVAKILVSRGASLKVRDNRKWTPMIIAAAAGATETVKTLADLGADIEARDANGWTPLMRASGAGSLSTVKLLLGRNADRRVRNNTGKGLIYIARNRGNVEMIDLLRQNGVTE